MKKQVFSTTILLIALVLIIASCDSSAKKAESKKDGINVGNITPDNKASGNLAITLDEATLLMQKYNRLTEKWFTYTYTRAWIEIIQISENKYNYYLGIEASLESKNNEQPYSCYSIYTELEQTNNSLIFYPDAFQQSCRGKFCKSCKLVLFENNELGCDCVSSVNDPENKEEGKCNHSISRVMSEEQEKNDEI
ncbi:MAG: hypothetical protein HQ521_19100 [Bacteroidetes bacterium]|nr:hypothetical protein [Bacteroidota bacterium]